MDARRQRAGSGSWGRGVAFGSGVETRHGFVRASEGSSACMHVLMQVHGLGRGCSRVVGSGKPNEGCDDTPVPGEEEEGERGSELGTCGSREADQVRQRPICDAGL
eukprot:3609930-Rhodomonas_salina.1